MNLSSSKPDPERPTVLLCEGDRDLRLALAALLERDGWYVLAAAELREAISRAIADSPDCIVLSQSLPIGDTGEALNSLRGLAGASAAPVVLIAPAEIPLGEPAGFLPDRDRRLTPTFRPEELLAAVREAVAAKACDPEPA